MFAVIRHAGYSLGSGSLTEDGTAKALNLAKKLASVAPGWKEIRSSPTPRARETASIMGQELHLPLEIDERVSMEGNLVDLLPPTEPHDIIFVSHLPILTKMLRSWSQIFQQDEPPLTEVACGYVIDPEKKTIEAITP